MFETTKYSPGFTEYSTVLEYNDFVMSSLMLKKMNGKLIMLQKVSIVSVGAFSFRQVR